MDGREWGEAEARAQEASPPAAEIGQEVWMVLPALLLAPECQVCGSSFSCEMRLCLVKCTLYAALRVIYFQEEAARSCSRTVLKGSDRRPGKVTSFRQPGGLPWGQVSPRWEGCGGGTPGGVGAKSFQTSGCDNHSSVGESYVPSPWVRSAPVSGESKIQQR